MPKTLVLHHCSWQRLHTAMQCFLFQNKWINKWGMGLEPNSDHFGLIRLQDIVSEICSEAVLWASIKHVFLPAELFFWQPSRKTVPVQSFSNRPVMYCNTEHVQWGLCAPRCSSVQCVWASGDHAGMFSAEKVDRCPPYVLTLVVFFWLYWLELDVILLSLCWHILPYQWSSCKCAEH